MPDIMTGEWEDGAFVVLLFLLYIITPKKRKILEKCINIPFLGSSANIRVWRDVESHAVAVWKISQKSLDHKKIFIFAAIIQQIKI